MVPVDDGFRWFLYGSYVLKIIASRSPKSEGIGHDNIVAFESLRLGEKLISTANFASSGICLTGDGGYDKALLSMTELNIPVIQNCYLLVRIHGLKATIPKREDPQTENRGVSGASTNPAARRALASRKPELYHR